MGYSLRVGDVLLRPRPLYFRSRAGIVVTVVIYSSCVSINDEWGEAPTKSAEKSADALALPPLPQRAAPAS